MYSDLSVDKTLYVDRMIAQLLHIEALAPKSLIINTKHDIKREL